MTYFPPALPFNASKIHFSTISLILVFLMSMVPATVRAQADGEDMTLLHHIHFENGIGNWSAENGIWEAGSPVAGPDSAYQGSGVAATILNGEYPANTSSRLVSPNYILPSKESLNGGRLRLSLKHWYSMSSNDTGQIQISINQGPWRTMPDTETLSGLSNGWQHLVVGNLTAYADSSIRLGFLFNSSDSFTGEGWYIDDIQIFSESSESINNQNFEGTVLDWLAEDNHWQFGQPTSGPMQAYEGKRVAGTTLSGVYADVDTMRLESPIITVSDILPGEVHAVKFWHWFDLAAGDSARLQVWYDGSGWTEITDRFYGESGAWTNYILPVIDPDTTDIKQFKIAFELTTEFNGSNGAGWYLDAFETTSLQSPVNLLATGPFAQSTIGPSPIANQEWYSDNGIWETGNPSNAPFPTDSTTYLAGTILNGNYPNGGESRFVSPNLFTGAAGAYLILNHWFDFYPGDEGIVQIRLDGGEWMNTSYRFTGSGGVFTQARLELTSDIIDKNFQLGFLFTSAPEGPTRAGWYIKSVQIGAVGTSTEASLKAGEPIVLFQNYPNPFTQSTTISFQLPERDHVQLQVFDLLGREVDTVLDGTMPAGTHLVAWEAAGRPSGMYLYRLKTGTQVHKRQLIIFR